LYEVVCVGLPTLAQQFDSFYEIQDPETAEEYLRRWIAEVDATDLAPLHKFARMLEDHWLGVIRWHHSKVSNGLLEGLNSLIQAAKRRARGYRSNRNFITMIYLIVGKLNAAVNAGTGLLTWSGQVTGVAALRLTADAVLDLWQRDEHQAEGDRTAASAELVRSSSRVNSWYDELAASLGDRREVPVPLPRDDDAGYRFVEAVRHDLLGQDGNATATAVRMIWTSDHLDAARRMQVSLVDPARAATDPQTQSPLAGIRPWRLVRA